MAGKNIVVLGRKLEKCGLLSCIYQNRLDAAKEMFNSNGYERIIISGGDVSDTGKTEARAGLDYLLETSDIDASDVVLEEEALDTIGNIAYAKELLIESRDYSPCVITTSYHVPRVMDICSYLLGDEFDPVFKPANSGLDETSYERHEESEIDKRMKAFDFFESLGVRKGEHGKVIEYLRNELYVVKDMT